jgi:hypothetical protein
VQPVGVAAQAAVSQHQPLRDPGRPRPHRRCRRGAARARGRRSRHLPACAQHNHTGKRLSDSPGRCCTTASHHPGPRGKRSALTGSEVRRPHARGTSVAGPQGPGSEGGWQGEERSARGGPGGGAGGWGMRARARACHAPLGWPGLASWASATSQSLPASSRVVDGGVPPCGPAAGGEGGAGLRMFPLDGISGPAT